MSRLHVCEPEEDFVLYALFEEGEVVFDQQSTLSNFCQLKQKLLIKEYPFLSIILEQSAWV